MLFFPVACALWNCWGSVSLTKTFTIIKQLLNHCLEINLKMQWHDLDQLEFFNLIWKYDVALGSLKKWVYADSYEPTLY